MPFRPMLLLVALAAAPAFADVKSGIDAYQRGDFASAVATWRPLATAGDADAQYNLGQAYRLGRGVPVDPQMAESWFKRAADQGHERARNGYGLMLFQNGRRAEAIPYIEEAAGHGYPQAQYVYATLLFNGDMVEKDWVRSYALMTRASAGGVAAATAGLAQLDKYVPVDQRARGLKLAQMFESAGTKSADAGDPPVTPAVRAPVKAGIAAAPLPPSQVAAPVPVAPRAVVAKAVPVKAAAVGGAWRVQLGAFGNGGKAEMLWTSLRAKVTALGPYQSFIVSAGAITRLQAGPLPSRAGAEALCGTVKAAGNACVVVAP